MTRQIDLRWSKAEDYEFALNLHLLAMRPYSEELIVWDEAKQRESFAVRRRRQQRSVSGERLPWSLTGIGDCRAEPAHSSEAA